MPVLRLSASTLVKIGLVCCFLANVELSKNFETRQTERAL
jgi:hypothetical protein